jgi:hypothetical protein
MRAAVGPLCIAAAAAAMPAGAARGIAPIPLRAHGCALSGTQVSCRALFGQESEKRDAKGGLLFGDFLLAKQEKVTRSPDASGNTQDASTKQEKKQRHWIPACAGMTSKA